MNGNPYGAVPDALKETRLTLRDLMADHLANKVAEGRLNLAKISAETETAMVGANLKKEEMVNLRDMARLTQQANQFQEGQATRAGEFATTTGLAREGLNLQTKTQEDADAIEKRRVGVAESAEQRAAREETRKNEVKTAAEWVQAAGIAPGLLDFLGVDPTKPVKRQDAEHLYTTMQATFKSNPALGFMAHGYALKRDLLDLQDQLKTPNLAPEKAAALQNVYNAKFRNFEILDKLIQAEKTPNQAEIIKQAREAYTNVPGLTTEFPTFGKFLDSFSKDVATARSIFQDDIKKLKGGLPDKDAPTNAKIDELVKTITLLPISPVEQKRIIERAKTADDPNKRLLILQEELGKVAQPRSKTASPDAALALMAGHPTTGSLRTLPELSREIEKADQARTEALALRKAEQGQRYDRKRAELQRQGKTAREIENLIGKRPILD